MKKLTSDHVNYLIWRYLQERGFAYTALQLQREWKNESPQQLPFADAVNPLALVNILTDGLHWDDVGASRHSLNRKYTFLTDSTSAPPQNPGSEVRHVVDDEQSPSSIRRPNRPHSPQNSNVGNRGQTQRPDEDAMDVDDPLPPLPLKVEEPPPVTTADVGHERGVQTLPVHRPAEAKTVAIVDLDTAEVFSLDWVDSPVEGEEQRLLATGGHIWRAFRMPLSVNESPNVLKELGSSDFGRMVVSSSAVDSTGKKLALAVGQPCDYTKLIVMASSADQRDERLVLAKISGAVLLLRWSKSSELLFYTVKDVDEPPELPRARGFSVFNVTTRSVACMTEDDMPIEDAAWVNDTRVIACGDKSLNLFNVETTQMQDITRLASITTDRAWAIIRYDAVTKQACCVAPNDNTIALLVLGDDEYEGPQSSPLGKGSDLSSSRRGYSQVAEGTETGFRIRVEASQQGDGITAMEWQPLTAETAQSQRNETTMDVDDAIPTSPMQRSSDPSTTRILATSARNGTVTLWNAAMAASAEAIQPLRTLLMPDSIPALALAFSPNGRYVAASGTDTVCIWIVEEAPGTSGTAATLESRDKPFAVWTAAEGSDVHAESDADCEAWPYQCLSWNSAGTRLACSTHKTIVVIDMPTPSSTLPVAGSPIEIGVPVKEGDAITQEDTRGMVEVKLSTIIDAPS